MLIQLTLSFLRAEFDFNPSPNAVAPASPNLLPFEPRKQTINIFLLCAENSLQTVKVEFTECGVEHERLTQCPCTCFINTTTC